MTLKLATKNNLCIRYSLFHIRQRTCKLKTYRCVKQRFTCLGKKKKHGKEETVEKTE